MYQFLLFVAIFNVVAILFFALRYAVKTISEKRAQQQFTEPQQNHFQFSL